MALKMEEKAMEMDYLRIKLLANQSALEKILP